MLLLLQGRRGPDLSAGDSSSALSEALVSLRKLCHLGHPLTLHRAD